MFNQVCVNDGSGILFGFFGQKDLANSVLKRPKNISIFSFKSHISSWLLCISFLFFGCNVLAQNNQINLAGEWAFQIDSLDVGIKNEFYNHLLNDKITLPGSMTGNNKGDDVSVNTKWTGAIWNEVWFKDPMYAKYRDPKNTKISFWLQPIKHYVGVAWYQKKINIPKGWDNNMADLFMERCHWESTLWIDNHKIGMQNALAVPQIHTIAKKLLGVGQHTITIRIDNRIKDIEVGLDAHSVSDNTQTNWNGVVGEFKLMKKPSLEISDVQVFTDVELKKIHIKATVVNTSGRPVNDIIKLVVLGENNSAILPALTKKIRFIADSNFLEFDYDMGTKPLLWDEFNPNLYTLQVSLKSADLTKPISFGMRSFRANGKQFTVNSKPIFLRGTLECAIFPKTGYPPTDVPSWLRIFKICKDHGLNHVRFHSWCPPEAAFTAADQMGFYLSVEASSWAIFGDGKPIDKFIYDESNRIVKSYGNHPSFCTLSYGNEPRGKNLIPFLTNFVKYWKAKDARRLYTTASGWPIVPENDFNVTPDPRIQQWEAGVHSIINARSPNSDYDWAFSNVKWAQPTISHEIGQWCVYPNFDEMPKYNGFLKPTAFEIFKDRITENGMLNLADSFVLASGKLQVLCYKAEIEAALRTPNFGGFQLLDLHDFPGQGTALVGILDPFWDSKKYVNAKEFKSFCDTTVLLARLPKMIFNNDEDLKAIIEVAHFGQTALKNVLPKWQITDVNGNVLFEGTLNRTDIAIGNGLQLGVINQSLATVQKASQLKLNLMANDVKNSWDIFVYPKTNPPLLNDNILVTQILDKAANKILEEGGKVLLTLKKGSVKVGSGAEVAIGFSSIFWNTSWTNNQAPHTLGILCNPNHPALAEYPTQYHSNWQWWDAMSHSNAINMGKLSPTLKPIVRVIDDWVTAKPLALIFECKVGKGSLLVSGIDLLSDRDNRPEAEQLLYSLKKYMTSSKFLPSEVLTYQKLQTILISQ